MCIRDVAWLKESSRIRPLCTLAVPTSSFNISKHGSGARALKDPDPWVAERWSANRLVWETSRSED